MPTLRLTSYDAFVEPLNYHQQASLFLQRVGADLPQHAAAVLGPLHRHHPRFASQLSRMITELSQRLTDEGQGHERAITYLQSHRQFLAQNEALLSGTPVAEFPPLTDVILDWLQVTHTPLPGCFEAIRQFMNTYEHDLYSADRKLREFEDVVWRALHRPDSLRVHVDWSGNPLADGAADIVNLGADHLVNDPVELALAFIREHEGDIRRLVDSMRKGLETIFLPLVDGEELQDLIDEVAALRQAYQHHISEPFVPTTQRFVASYQPPKGQTSYHDSLASVSNQQGYTLDAITTLLTQLQAMQTFNEQLVGSQLAIGGFLLLGLAAVAAVIVFFPDAPAALAGALGSVEGIVAELAAVALDWELIAGAFAAIEAATGLPALVWVLIALAAVGTTVVLIHSHEVVSTGATTHHMEPTILGGKRQAKQNLSPEEISRIAARLAKEFGDVSEEEIAALLRIYGNEEVVRYFLKHLEDLKALGQGWGITIESLFREFVRLATEGTEFNLAEGIIGLYFFLQGMALVRANNPAYDFTNTADGTNWDVKSFTSNKSIDDMYAEIKHEVRLGEHVMIDTTNMTEDEANALAKKLTNNIDDLTAAQKNFDPASWFEWYPPRVWP